MVKLAESPVRILWWVLGRGSSQTPGWKLSGSLWSRAAVLAFLVLPSAGCVAGAQPVLNALADPALSCMEQMVSLRGSGPALLRLNRLSVLPCVWLWGAGWAMPGHVWDLYQVDTAMLSSLQRGEWPRGRRRRKVKRPTLPAAPTLSLGIRGQEPHLTHGGGAGCVPEVIARSAF